GSRRAWTRRGRGRTSARPAGARRRAAGEPRSSRESNEVRVTGLLDVRTRARAWYERAVRRLLVPLCALLLLGLASATSGGAIAGEGICGAATGVAADVTATGATLNGTLGAYPGDAMICGAWQFDYGTTTAYGWSTAIGQPVEGGSV